MELRWVYTNEDHSEKVNALSNTLNIPPIMARMLLRRGISDREQALRFFRPSLDQLYDPFLMRDMTKAVDRLRQAVLSEEQIHIYGDYDVDGITSVSFLYMILQEIGAQVSYHIPNRQTEGYGLSREGIEQASRNGVGLIVTVDCGVTGHEEVRLAHSLGVDVIVTDHHQPGPDLPQAVAVIDPKRFDCPYPFKELAGVGVAYKLAQGLLSRMNIDLSILEHYLEFVAIGTSADIVPLVDENRIFVKIGLQKLNAVENIGLKSLLEVAGLYGKDITTGHIVFIIAPRINAVGRMGDAERAVELFSTDDPNQARHIAGILESENRYRKSVDEETFREAKVQAEDLFNRTCTHSLVLHQEGWHPGVIGIAASRVVEQYYRPSVLISVEDGIGKGSARSVQGFDLYESLKQCEDLLVAYGGHKYAAGLTIEADKIEEFRHRFESVAQGRLTPELMIPKLHIDAEISLEQIDERFLRFVKMFAPFGPKNTRPLFVSRDLHVAGSPSIVGSNHLKFRVRQKSHTFDVIGFGLGQHYQRIVSGEHHLSMVYVVDENEYMGRKYLQLRAKDFK